MIILKAKTKKRAITLVEILIATVVFAVAMLPVASIIFKSTRTSHEMNYETTAENIAKNMLEQVLKSVKFEDVTMTRLTVGVDVTGNKINLAMNGATINGNTSGGVINYEKASFKYEFEIKDIKSSDMFISFARQDRSWSATDHKAPAGGWPVANPNAFLNWPVKNLVPANTIMIKTVKLKISWCNEGENSFTDARRKLVLLTRKARLEGALN